MLQASFSSLQKGNTYMQACWQQINNFLIKTKGFTSSLCFVPPQQALNCCKSLSGQRPYMYREICFIFSLFISLIMLLWSSMKNRFDRMEDHRIYNHGARFPARPLNASIFEQKTLSCLMFESFLQFFWRIYSCEL